MRKDAGGADAVSKQRNQEVQRELLERASKNPGVADAMQVYGRVSKYSPSIASEQPRVWHATGGNSGAVDANLG
jgi:hypothetical protein